VITGRLTRPVTLGVLMALLISSSALGWTQLRNAYPDTPQSCGDDPNDGYPCIEWPLSPSGYSITVYVYLWPSLESGNLNLKTDVRNGMGYWNNQPARNPFYYESTTGTKVNVHRTTTSRSDIWAETYTYSNSSNVVTSAMIRFNPLVTWNRNYTYSTYAADARKVATHELGHSQALGHTGYTAVMKQGPMNLHTPQTNDTQGLQAIYGAA